MKKPMLFLLLAICLAAIVLTGCQTNPRLSAASGASALPLPTSIPTPAATPAPTPTATPEPPLYGLVIGIDPGHQRIYNPDPEPIAPGETETKQKVAGGARGTRTGTMEYEVNLAVGLLLRERLETLGATVCITRTTNDVDISNRERAEFFNEHEVALGIRLHCNRSDISNARGAFMLVPTKNRTDWYDECVAAAGCIIQEYCRSTGLQMNYSNRSGITERSDQTGFNWCTRPIVTIEMGFMSNAEDDALLADPDFQEKMAQGLCEGIQVWYRTCVEAGATPGDG